MDKVFTGTASAKISSAPRADNAEAALTVVTDNYHKGKVFELAEDEANTRNYWDTIITKQSDKKSLTTPPLS